MKKYLTILVLFLTIVSITSCEIDFAKIIESNSDSESDIDIEVTVTQSDYSDTESSSETKSVYIEASEESEIITSNDSDTDTENNGTSLTDNTVFDTDAVTIYVTDTGDPDESETEIDISTETIEDNSEKITGSVLHSHNFTKKILKDPNCKEPGLVVFECECGDNYTEELPKTENHNFSVKAIKEAACSVQGEITYVCDVCGYTYKEYIDKTEHSFIEYDKTVSTIGNDNEIHLKNNVVFYRCVVCEEYTNSQEQAWTDELIELFKTLKTENKYKAFEYYCKYIENMNFPTVNGLIGFSPPREAISEILFSDDTYSYPFDTDTMRNDLNEFARYLGYTAYQTNVNYFGEIINEDTGSWEFPCYLNIKSSNIEIYRMLISKVYSDLTSEDLNKDGLPCFYIYFKPSNNDEYWMFIIIC